MNSKARVRPSHAELSKTLQESPNAVDAGTEIPQSHREPSPKGGDLAEDAVPAQARKRALQATTERDPSKRVRLTQSDAEKSGVKEEKVVGADETALQQPKPSPPYASFLKEFVDPVCVGSPTSVDTFVSEWLESVRLDQETRCRSDSHLHHSNNDPVSRQLTRSAPEMGRKKGADGFAMPPTPASAGSRSRRPSTADGHSRFSATGTSGTSSTSGVRHRMYRQNNLEFNHIKIRRADAPLPEDVSGHINNTLRAERKSSPGLSSDDLKQTMAQLETIAAGCDEEDVAAFLNGTVFPNPKSDLTYGSDTGLSSTTGALISPHLVPADPTSPYKVSQPKPDKLYGYLGDSDIAFTQQQLLAQTMVHPRNPNYPAATSQGLRFPFFAIEFKAAGGTRGDLWVAANQCAGASSACLNAVYQLNTSLPECATRVDNLSYCIAVDNNTAQLYISWKEDNLNYYLQRVDAFLLSSPEHFENFRKQVRNILDWGKGARLKQIKDALDIILEENRRRASEAAKSRQPSNNDSATSSSKNQKSSSASKAQAQSGGASEPYWEVVSQDVVNGELSSFYPEVSQQNPALTSFDSATGSGFGIGDNNYIDTNGGPAPPEYLEDSQQDQFQALASFDSAEPLSRAASGFTSRFGNETGHHTSQDAYDESALPEYHYSADDQQNQSRAPTSFANAEAWAGFTTDQSNEVQPPAAADDDYWTSEQRL